MSTKLNNSYISNNKVIDCNNSDRMNRLGEKLSRIGGVIENEKITKFDNYENKIMSLLQSIEETRELNNRKFHDIKEQVLMIQKQ